MEQRKKIKFTHSKTGEVVEMYSFEDHPYFLKKAERAKEMLKDVKIPDHLLSK